MACVCVCVPGRTGRRREKYLRWNDSRRDGEREREGEEHQMEKMQLIKCKMHWLHSAHTHKYDQRGLRGESLETAVTYHASNEMDRAGAHLNFDILYFCNLISCTETFKNFNYENITIIIMWNERKNETFRWLLWKKNERIILCIENERKTEKLSHTHTLTLVRLKNMQ